MRHTKRLIGLVLMALLTGAAALAAERWAILVSITDYRDFHIVDLGRTSVDADLIERVLIRRWNFKPANIVKLKEQDATRQAILAKLQEIAQKAQAEDAVLFYFSGHGGTANQLFSLCPWDANAKNGTNDITETDLAEWVQSLKTTNVTIILDCCFDRVALKAPRIRPKAIGFARERGSAPAHTFGIPPERAVVLKACREDEKSLQEISASDDSSYGIFTYHLVKALSSVPPETNYRQLIERLQNDIKQYVHDMYPSERFLQTPQIAGSDHQQNRRLFEPNGKSLPPYHRIVRVEQDQVELDAGTSTDVIKGARYAVYPPNEETFDTSRQVGLIEVTEVKDTTATARILQGGNKVAVDGRAVLVEYPKLDSTDTLQLRLVLDAPEALLPTLRSAISETGFVRVVENPLENDWVLRVESTSGNSLKATLYESDRQTVVRRVVMRPSGEVELQSVETIAPNINALMEQFNPILVNFYAARVLLNLKNPNPAFRVELTTNQSRYREGESFSVRFRSDKDCYLTLIAIDPTGTPTVLYPWGTNQPQKIAAGKEYIFDGPSADIKWVIRPPLGRECIVAIATLQAIPTDRLENLLQAMGQLQQATTRRRPLPAGIKAVAVEPVRQIQNLPLDQWNVVLAHFLTEGKDGAQQK